MRRYIWVSAVVVLIVLCAWLVQDHMHGQIKDFEAQFEQLHQLVETGDFSQAKALCDRLVTDWDEKREYWEVFIDHSVLDEAQATIYELQGYLQSDAPYYQLHSVFRRLEAELLQIDMQTRLTIGHLL
ncbi:MAG: DUF4363 family protein [Clostridia bacterium]|nr:DUF4363 family protein [Clostridia bacterium]